MVLGSSGDDEVPHALAEVRAALPVLHETGRVLTCLCHSDEAAALARRHDVDGVYAQAVPDEVRRRLGEGESVFVQAWEQRRAASRATPPQTAPSPQDRPAGRRGEGAGWGDDEFEPPDLMS